MPEDAAAYLLLAVNVVVVALVLTLPLIAVAAVLNRVRHRRAGAPGSAPVNAPDKAPGSAPGSAPADAPADAPDSVVRRCNACGTGWRGRPGRDSSRLVLRVRRWARRRGRRRGREPAWARRRGWDRCPSCLSSDVRESTRTSTHRSRR